jgi:hypothetical protein
MSILKDFIVSLLHLLLELVLELYLNIIHSDAFYIQWLYLTCYIGST